MFILGIISVFVLIYYIFFLTQSFNVIIKGYAPFIATDKETTKTIINELKIKERPIIYELGCGRARFLREAEKKYLKARLIGIENLFTIYLINKIRFKLIGSRIELLKTNFFKVNLEDADVIYCYLNNSTMQSLGQKFLDECKMGTQIISRSFPIPQLTPEKIIRVKSKKIYFYNLK